MVMKHKLEIVYWHDIMNDCHVDDDTIGWPFSFGDATYTCVTIPVVREEMQTHLADLQAAKSAMLADGEEDVEVISEEIQAVQACVTLLNSLPATCLVAFDG